MSSTELVFTRPWLLFLLIPALAIILLPFFFLPKVRRKTFRKIVPVILHSIIALLLVLLISGMSFVTVSSEESVIFLVDCSDSTRGVREAILSDAEEFFGYVNENTPVGVVAFGADTVYQVELKTGEKKIGEVSLSSAATDIASAMEYAATLLPDDTAKRVVLFSDGKETDGAALDAARHLTALGVKIDTVYFDTTSGIGKEMQVSEFTASESVYKGESVIFKMKVDSTGDGLASVTLSDNGKKVAASEFEISEGGSTLSFKITPEGDGAHIYTVEISSEDDTLTENNTASCCVNVIGDPKVLIIADTITEGSKMKNLLSTDHEVKTVTSRNVPKSIVELCKYDEILLINVDVGDLPRGYSDLLSEYVSDYGRSIFTIGGEEAYALGGMKDTAYEELLPVTLEFNKRETQNSVAMLLVLDCSRSMSNSSNNLALAKQGAIACLKTMSECDYIGVVSFNEFAYLDAPLTLATEANKAEVERVISGLSTGSGTWYGPALECAYDEMIKSDAPAKHVIFLSDGQPSDYSFNPTVEKMKKAGITVSSIGLGYSSYFLTDIATIGGGRYYYVGSAYDLPEIMLSEAETVTVSPLVYGQFTPIIAKDSPVTAGINKDFIPTLDAYIGSTPREDAEVFLTVPDGYPLFATWRYGKGRVSSFMSDLSGTWSEKWLADEIGMEISRNFVSATLTEGHMPTALNLEFTKQGKSTHLLVETTATDIKDRITVASEHMGKTDFLTLTMTGKGLYEGDIPTENVGLYSISVTQYDKKDQIIDFTNTLLSVVTMKEYDVFADGGADLLENVAAYAGGVFLEHGEDPTPFVESQPEEIEFRYSPIIPLGIAAAILYIADIAIRKLRLKDIKKFFGGRTKEA